MSGQEIDRVARRYHLDRGHRRLETQQEAIEEADRRVEDGTRGSWLLGPFAPILKRLHEDAATIRYDHKLPGEVAGLAQGLELRAAPAFEPHDYESYSHSQLHDMVTQGVDPGAVGEMGDTWLRIGNALTSFQDDIARTLARSETTWQGAAGDRARQAVASLGNRGAQAGQAAQLAGVVLHQQSAALATARNSMPPPPSHPFDAGAAERKLQTVTDPIAFATQAAADQRAFQQQKAAHQEAARVVKEYDTTVAQTSRHLPAFASATAMPATTPMGRATRTRGSRSSEDAGQSGIEHDSRAPTRRTTTPDSAGASGGGETNVPASPVAGGGGTNATGDETTATGGGSLKGTGGLARSSPLAGVGGSSGNGLAALGRDPARGGFEEYLPGGGRSAIREPSAGRGAGASRGAGRAGPGARSGAEARSAGARSAGALTAEEATAERGATGIPPVARGRRAEDEEHKRPEYLREPDIDGIFGSDETTAPPVIG